MKNKLLIIIFGTILILPTISIILGLNKLVLNENRILNPLPKIGIYKNFPILFTDYFSDHYGLRNYLIVANKWMRYKLFGVSTNKAIAIGKENWLFYMPDINYIDTINDQPFSQNDLEQIKNNLVDVQNKFKKNGVNFYFLVAPNKQSIYPEYLPSYIKKIRPDSRLDQLTSFVENDKSLNFINPKNELLKAKEKELVYLKYDTHWNQLGAYVAYEKLFKRINNDFKNVEPKKYDSFEIKKGTAVNKDLAIQMGVDDNFSEEEITLTNADKKAKIVEENCPFIYTGCPLTIREVDNKKLPKLVMFRDSFGVGLIPFIEEHFSRSYFYWGPVPFNYSIVEKEKPDIVIMELTERELWRLKNKLFEWEK